MHALLLTITKYSYFGIFVALGLGILGFPLPDETLIAFAGFLVYEGKLNYLYAFAVCFIGTSSGVTLGYFLGRTFGNRLIKRYSTRLNVDPDHIQNAKKFYLRYGKFALFAGYFIPGVRHLTAIFAGTSIMPYPVFAAFAYSGAALWSIVFMNLGFFLGENWHRVSAYSNRYIIPFILVVTIFLIIAIYWKVTGQTKDEHEKQK
ncbi:MAG TPA: DedA family protein [Syntrophales bacterium]|nr:DedA family protein [Syntrophales bacterium]